MAKGISVRPHGVILHAQPSQKALRDAQRRHAAWVKGQLFKPAIVDKVRAALIAELEAANEGRIPFTTRKRKRTKARAKS